MRTTWLDKNQTEGNATKEKIEETRTTTCAWCSSWLRLIEEPTIINVTSRKNKEIQKKRYVHIVLLIPFIILAFFSPSPSLDSDPGSPGTIFFCAHLGAHISHAHLPILLSHPCARLTCCALCQGKKGWKRDRFRAKKKNTWYTLSATLIGVPIPCTPTQSTEFYMYAHLDPTPHDDIRARFR